MKKMFLALSGALFVCCCPAGADEPPAADQFKVKAVSLAVRAGMKAYLLNADFPGLKKAKMAEISRRTTPQFEADYKQAWTVLQKCPGLVSKYRLRQNMAKPEVLRIISRLTRDECLEAIDNIPDEVVFEQFNSCLNDPEIQDKPFHEQMDIIMKKMTAGNGS